MPILTSQEKKQKNLVVVMALVLVVTLTVLYFGFFKGGGPDSKFIDKEGYLDIFLGVREIKLNTDFLEGNKFRSLVPYDKISTDVYTGRNNPFSSY